ncbi:MAG: hypothetical protein ACE5LU_19780 [Anaerolineae bacterium]
MSLPTSLVIGQLRLVRGVRQDETLTVRVFEPRSILRRQDPGILFILIDLLGENPDDDILLGELMETTQRAYEQQSGSTTRRLRQAAAAANQYLLEWNRERTNDRQAAGITCAVLVEDEVYLAQAGPALACVAHPGVIRQFPIDSPWLSEEPLESMPGGIWTPLGIRNEVYVDLNSVQVGPGYTLLLASAHLPQLLTEDDIADLLDQDPEDILRDLAVMASGQDLSALVANLLEPKPADPSTALRTSVTPATEPVPEPSGPSLGDRVFTAMRHGVVGVGSAGAAILGGIARVLEGLLPERVGREELESSGRRRRALMWLAIIIPVALALLTVVMYWGRRGDRETLFLDLVQSASGRAEQAQALVETDPTQARELLLVASQELDRALRLRPNDGPSASSGRRLAERLRADVESRLEAMEGVVRLTDLATVASLPGAVDDRRRLIVQGTSAYVLNAREQAVHRVGLGDRRLVEILKSGDTQAGQSVGPLVDMAWVPAGGVRDQGAVIVLDSTGTAWQIDAVGDVVPLKVAGAENWRGLRLVGGFAGNLYVLDIGLGQILKYLPTVDGYAIPPVEWLSAEAVVDLGNVVDMAIDGSIYLFRSSGRVEKLVAGKPEPFDQPDEFDLTKPVTCFATPPSGRVFLADATRVLQFDAAGIFQRQLLPPEGRWERLDALWVDEINGWLYAVDAGTLVMAALPHSDQ